MIKGRKIDNKSGMLLLYTLYINAEKSNKKNLKNSEIVFEMLKHLEYNGEKFNFKPWLNKI